jgi:DNA repair protein RadD
MMLEAAHRGKRLLFLAHRRELITQAAERLESFGLTPGIVMGSRKDIDAQIVVASVSTLVNLLDVIGEFDLVFVDEAHHFVLGKIADDAASEFASEVAPKVKKLGMYRRVFDRFVDSAIFVGLTATPVRLDGKLLGDVFERLIEPEVDGQKVNLVWLQDNGFLVPARYFAGRLKPDLEGLTVSKDSGDYSSKKAFERMNDKALFADVVAHYQQRAAGKSAVVFNVNVAHSKSMVAEFLAAGIPSAHLDGTTPDTERDQIIADFKSGAILVLNNVGIVGEGVDIPGIECVIMNRPTESVVIWLQAIGRALRPVYLPGMPLDTPDERLAAIIWSDKPEATILDHGGNCLRLGFAETEREFSLTGKRKKKGRPPVTECPEAHGGCGRLMPGVPLVCPQCGFVLREAVEEPETPAGKKLVKGELVEVTPELLKKPALDMSFAELETIRRRNKSHLNWLIHQLRHRAKMEMIKGVHDGTLTLDPNVEVPAAKLALELGIFATLVKDFGDFMGYKPGFVHRTLEQFGLELTQQ